MAKAAMTVERVPIGDAGGVHARVTGAWVNIARIISGRANIERTISVRVQRAGEQRAGEQ
jgi:hypothetical protein